ncbi:MAG: hypothetical protein H7Z37_08470, partial [Pyrinomonadaceae bacterium]|nr:hypothetical protein [Pyrinomonadaceae bacterium]
MERRDLTPRKENKGREKTEIQRNFEPKLPAVAEPYQGYRGASMANEENGLQLMDYWRAIRKRLWLVIGITVLVTTLAAIYMSRRPNIYSAQARVQVDLEQVNPELVSSERRSPIVNSDPAYFNTQLQNLTSPSLLRRVVKETNLENNKDFVVTKDGSRGGWRGLLRNIGIGGEDKKSASGDSVPVATGLSPTSSDSDDLAEAKRLAPYVEAIQKELTVDPVREARSVFKDTRLIDISFRNTNPDLAALIVNTTADVFTKSNQEKKTKTSGKTNDYLQDRVASLQAEIRADEVRLGRNTRQAGVLALDKDKTIALERLQGLQKQQLDAQEIRKNAEAQYNAASKPEALAALAEDSQARKYLDDTKLDIDKLTKERERLSIEYTNDAPEVKEIDKQITSLTKALDEYREKSRSYLLTQYKTRYEQAKQQEDSINSAYNNQYNQAQVQNEAGINLRLLQQNIDNKKGLLENLFRQQRENDVVSVGSENNINVVDRAVPNDTPVAPARVTSVVAAFALSLAFGCGLALFLEYLDDTVRSPADVENILRLPALAVIPTVDSMPRRKLLLAGKNGEGNDRSELLISNDSRSALAEAYRQLRTSVLLSTAGQAPKSLLVTSSVPSEGKTTTAVN